MCRTRAWGCSRASRTARKKLSEQARGDPWRANYQLHGPRTLRDRGLPDTIASGNFWGIPQPDQQLGLARGQFAPDANTVDDGIDIVILTNDGTGLDPYYVVPDVFRVALTSSATQSRSSARTRVKGIR
jgi:hypothetical protein